jgi:sarcosine oxidase subunit beta
LVCSNEMDIRTDVLIIGGGLTGCALAHHLARTGIDVLLVEKGDINQAASGQNAGSLHFQLEKRFLENGPEAARQASALVALNRLAIADWQGLEQELQADLELTMVGGLMLAETEAELSLLEQKRVLESDWGLSSEILASSAVRELAPYLSTSVKAAAFLADEGHANPRLVTPAYLRSALRHGATVSTNTEVTAIHKGGPSDYRLELQSAQGRRTARASRLVLAAGAFTARVAQLANLQIPVYLAALSMNITEKRAPLFRHLVQHVGKRLSMKQARSGNILLGGGWPAKLDRAANGEFNPAQRPRLLEQSIKGNLRAAVAAVPAVAELCLIRSWTGIATLTPDQLPILGEVPSSPGLFVAAGGPGFTLGPTFARLLANEITGRGAKDSIAAIFSPARFDQLNRFLGRAV